MCERFSLLTRAFVNENTDENTKRYLQSAIEEFNFAKINETPTILCDQGSNIILTAKLMRLYQINCAAHVFHSVIFLRSSQFDGRFTLEVRSL
jgi:hypothetical protein